MARSLDEQVEGYVWVRGKDLLSAFAFAADTIRVWTENHGTAEAARMAGQACWGEPYRSCFETAWGR